jgi:proteasome accessory factor C
VPGGDEWFADDELPAALLHVPASGGWVAERYPTRSVVADGEGWLIEVTVASERWLRDLLLRLGPAAAVLQPAEWRDLGATAAGELLTRYEEMGNDGN